METYKRYLLSSFVTFFSAFSLVLIVSLGTVDYTQTAIVSVLFVAIRAGFKALGEWMVGNTADLPPSDINTFSPNQG